MRRLLSWSPRGMEIEMRADGLSEPEGRLWMEFSYGTHIDLRTGDPRCDDPAGAQSWGPERIVRAEVIRNLLVGRRLDDEQQRNQQDRGQSPSVFLSGARITGQLDLRGLDFAPPLLLQQCALDEPLVIADSMSRSIRLYGCHLPGVQGSWLKCAGDLHLRDCQVDGAVDLAGAYIGGQLVLSGSTLSTPGGIAAVRGDGLVVVGDLFCRDGAVVQGEVSLVAARIGGELRFSASELRNPEGIALHADRITVEKDMYCREGFAAEGEVRLANGQVKGQLNFDRATLRNRGKVALCADHLVVGRHLYCQDDFTTEGEVSLVAARVGGEVRFSASALSNPGNVALRADRLYVSDDMYCRQALKVTGSVSLRGAHIKGQLNFNHATVRNPGKVALCADQLVVGSHLYCQDDFTTEGEISLVAARVGGEVRFSASALSNPGNVALRADRLVVADDMYCRERLKIDGGVSLRGAHIKGVVNFSTTAIHNPEGIAIQADQLTVGSDLCCDEGFRAEGMIDLTDAHVNGELNLSNATLNNPGNVALHAPRLIVDQDMFCRDKFTAEGTVCLIGAHIGGKLSFTSACLIGARLTENQLSGTRIEQMLTRGVEPVEPRPVRNPPAGRSLAKKQRRDIQVKPDAMRANEEIAKAEIAKAEIVSGAFGLALVADGLRVDIDMTCDTGFTSRGEIRLKGARISRNLDFSDAEVNNETGVALNAEDMQAERMLMPARCEAGRISLRYGKMVELDDKRGVRPDQIDITGLSYETLIPPLDPETRLQWLAENDYEPQPYDQMARSYRRLGYEDSARKVQLAQERRRRGTLSRGRKVFSRAQDLATGYGYLPHRAAALFVFFLLVGVVVFWHWPPRPIGGKDIYFDPIFYTLNVLIPFVNFGQRDLWNSTSGLEVFKVFLAGCGWVLAIIAFPGIKRWLTRS
ncbi:MAG: hypothetical protein JO281_00025 [Pseudonocardiales bacterium]|nr:hypothetical protein [Pseudonocardiales bacterium]